MNVHNGSIVYLSVNHDGRLSLWDTQRAAVDGRERHEALIALQLTADQLALIADATKLSAAKLSSEE